MSDIPYIPLEFFFQKRPGLALPFMVTPQFVLCPQGIIKDGLLHPLSTDELTHICQHIGEHHRDCLYCIENRNGL